MQCITTTVRTNIEASVIIPLINDTAIFLAINYRILTHTTAANSPIAHLRAFFGGTAQSALSQALLQSGQHFYLIAVVTHIVLLVLLKLPHFLPIYHAMPGFALINVMACQVFRRIKFGLSSSDGTSQIPTIGLRSDFHPETANPSSLSLHFRPIDPSTAELGSNKAFPLEVHMQEVDKFEEGTEASEVCKPTDLA
ncbi:hypothetical protein MSAN_02307500 [Mycena sanguinolenta]|uniref:Uncharacterized protein n=1 Tax=Mycena sanguinolenta TaxID=230812 RepID=A0A8H6X8H6_9AGAR|nr:hypothetical protein MSAN_02307500 [Mycena sanguinolenta]